MKDSMSSSREEQQKMMQTHLKEQILVQTTMLSDSFEPRSQRRRIDYIAENPNPHPYVKKWLEEPFLSDLRKNPDFKYFLNFLF